LLSNIAKSKGRKTVREGQNPGGRGVRDKERSSIRRKEVVEKRGEEKGRKRRILRSEGKSLKGTFFTRR